MLDSYKQQRYERLAETLDEYIGCSGDECGMDFFIRDVKKSTLRYAVLSRKSDG